MLRRSSRLKKETAPAQPEKRGRGKAEEKKTKMKKTQTKKEEANASSAASVETTGTFSLFEKLFVDPDHKDVASVVMRQLAVSDPVSLCQMREWSPAYCQVVDRFISQGKLRSMAALLLLEPPRDIVERVYASLDADSRSVKLSEDCTSHDGEECIWNLMAMGTRFSDQEDYWASALLWVFGMDNEGEYIADCDGVKELTCSICEEEETWGIVEAQTCMKCLVVHYPLTAMKATLKYEIGMRRRDPLSLQENEIKGSDVDDFEPDEGELNLDGEASYFVLDLVGDYGDMIVINDFFIGKNK
jgi:hypothetical protein